MKRVLFSFWNILSIVAFLLFSCGGVEDLEDPSVDELEPGDFIATLFIEDAEDSVFSSDETVIICEGETILFELNDSDLTVAYEWSFPGGTPSTSTASEVSVLYAEEGTYDVILTAIDQSPAAQNEVRTVSGYVEVVKKEPEPDPEAEQEEICVLVSEETDDGFLTEFEYDDETLALAYKYINGNLEEVSEYVFNELGHLELERFLNAVNEILGTRTMFYNSENQLIRELTEAADGSLVRERIFTWDDAEDVPISAMYTEPDMAGGNITFDVSFRWDVNYTNIIEERFEIGGVYAGSNFYEHDTYEKPLTGLGIDATPLLFNTNNVTSLISEDASGTIIRDIQSTFELPNGLENDDPCLNRVVGEIRLEGTSTREFQFNYQIRIVE